MVITRVVYFLLLGVVQKATSNVSPQVVHVPPRPNYFTAAVFEHARLGNWTTQSPHEIININLDYYRRATEVAKAQGADIILFPEYGILHLLSRPEMKEYLESVPDPKKVSFNPCVRKEELLDKPMLTNLSCMAKENRIVVLANMLSIQPCNNEETEYCPEDGSLYLNTNFVFDRDGTIISKYHKEHLFFEITLDLPQEPQDPVFTTDFGTFASFICFDIMFKHMVDTAQDPRVDGIFLSAFWGDIKPFLNSVQNWQGWAIGNKVNLIVSNVQLPGYGITGSGVFTGNMGPLKYTHNPDGVSKLLVSRVPKWRNQEHPFPNPEATITIITSNSTKAYDENDTDFQTYLPEYCDYNLLGPPQNIYGDYRCSTERTVNYTLVKMKGSVGHLEACNNGMCCTLDYSASDMNETFYFGVANITHNFYDRYYWCEEKCLVVRCEAHNGSECSLFPTKSSTIFQKLELKANFTTPFVYPSVVRTGMRLAPIREWEYDVQDQNISYSSFLKYENFRSVPLLVAGLNGRCFDRDPPYVR